MEMVFPIAPPLFAAQAPTNANDEARLIERARAGEVGALDELMNRHRARILNLTFQITRDRDRDIAEDCAQEAFVRAFSKLNLFRAQLSFATWLYRIALNVALEKGRVIPLRAQLNRNLDRQVPIGEIAWMREQIAKTK